MKIFMFAPLVLFFGTIAIAGTDDGKFFLNIPEYVSKNTPPSEPRIEFEIYSRAAPDQRWKEEGKDSICYGTSIPGCYRWVGNLLVEISLPCQPDQSVITNAYSYGIGFSIGSDGKVEIRSSVDHQKKLSAEADLVSVFPNYKSTSVQGPAGTWGEIEFAESSSRYILLRARLTGVK